MWNLYLAVALALAAFSTARPVEDTPPPAFVNMTAQRPANSGSIRRDDLPNYNMLELFTEPNEGGYFYYIDRVMVKYATCVTFTDVDQKGGITSLVSYKNQQGLVYYCLNYKLPDCHGGPLWWKGLFRTDQLDADWDNTIHSARCHHGLGPDDYPDPNGGSAVQTPANSGNVYGGITSAAPDVHDTNIGEASLPTR